MSVASNSFGGGGGRGSGGADRVRGRCKWFRDEKGYGFLESEHGEDVFVHQTSINATGYRTLTEGQEVEFDVETDDMGRKKAVRVSAIGGAPVQGAPRYSNDVSFAAPRVVSRDNSTRGYY